MGDSATGNFFGWGWNAWYKFFGYDWKISMGNFWKRDMREPGKNQSLMNGHDATLSPTNRLLMKSILTVLVPMKSVHQSQVKMGL